MDIETITAAPLDTPRREGGWLPLGVDAALLDGSFGLSIWGSFSLIFRRGFATDGGGVRSSDSTSKAPCGP